MKGKSLEVPLQKSIVKYWNIKFVFFNKWNACNFNFIFKNNWGVV